MLKNTKQKIIFLTATFLLLSGTLYFIHNSKAQTNTVSLTGYAWSENIGWISFGGNIAAASVSPSLPPSPQPPSPLLSCTPDAPVTQTLKCDEGQTIGSIIQTRTSICVEGSSTPLTSDWVTTTNTCATPCTTICWSWGDFCPENGVKICENSHTYPYNCVGSIGSTPTQACIPLQWSDNMGSTNWSSAKVACAAMGSDWRLPSVGEIEATLLNRFTAYAFQANSLYWTSLDYTSQFAGVKGSNGAYLSGSIDYKSSSHPFRCVRSMII